MSTVNTFTAGTSDGAFNYIPGTAEYTGNPTGTYTQITDKAYLDDYHNGRHFQGVNVAFADGHAKWVKSQDIYTEAKKATGGAWRLD